MDITETELYTHLLNTYPGFGPKRLSRLLNHFPSAKTAYNATVQELNEAGIEEPHARKFLLHKNTQSAESEAEKLARSSIKLLLYDNPTYPNLLREISDPPVALYYKGTLPEAGTLMLAVVGTRKITTYGKVVLPQILGPLIKSGVVIVSGMAFGVDAQSHEEALTQGQPTIAVLGSGLDDPSIYPKNHQLLASRIIDGGGLLLSEYPPGTPPFKQNFIARNRIISGLCAGTLIVECGLKSGSLITAQYALEQNRPLYVVPGPIYSAESAGPNSLLKMGALCVTEAQDIFNDLNITGPTASVLPLPDNLIESTILLNLSKAPLQLDELIKQTGLQSAEVSAALTVLELRGYIRDLGGQQFIKAR